MQSAKGNDVPNQFEIEAEDGLYFQSYRSMIAKVLHSGQVVLDETYWNYSRTTSKYLSMFLGEPISDVKKKIKSGVYLLTNLN